MKYAVIDGGGALHALLDLPDGSACSWSGPEGFGVVVGEFPEVDPGAELADYAWDGERFVPAAGE